MAAAGDAITTLVALREAHALVAKAHGTELAKRLLVGWLGEGRVRWDGKLIGGASSGQQKRLVRLFTHGQISPPYRYGTVFSPGDARFWQQDLEINWQESWAQARYLDRETGAYVLLGPIACKILVALEDIEARVPEFAQSPGEPSEPEKNAVYYTGAAGRPTSKHLCKAEMRQRANTGKLLSTLTAECEYLSNWLSATHPTAPSVEGKTLENSLRVDYRELKKNLKL